MRPALDLPEPVRLRAEAAGDAGRAWLAGLPNLVARLERDWDLSAGQPLHGGTGSCVVPAVTGAGEQVVLKLGMPGEDVSGEIATLTRGQGRGYARLLRADLGRQAMVLERLGPTLGSLGLPVAAQIEALCRTLAEAWTTPPPCDGLMTGAEKALWLIDFIETTWEQLDRPCSAAAIEQARGYAQDRHAAHDPTRCVLVHGDAHSGNALQVPGGEGFRFVDPDGLIAEPACDLAVPMREFNDELIAGDALALGLARCGRLADLTGVGPQAIWRWGVLERLATGLLATKLGYQPEARNMLAVADVWAGCDGPA